MNRGGFNYNNRGGRGYAQQSANYENAPQRGGWYGPGGRGRGGRGQGRYQRKEENREFVRTDKQRENATVNLDVPRATTVPSVGPPKPQYLSKVASEEKNDPLWKEAVFAEPSEDLKQRAKELHYHVGAEGFTELVTQTHEVIKTQTPGFSKRVPHCAFQYYCAAILYSRMLDVHAQNGYPVTYEEMEFVRVIKGCDYPVPGPNELYLSGIGNTTMPSGRNVNFRMLEREYVESEDLSQGWFGRVGPETHFLYRMYPCLAVYVRNIQASLLYTENPNAANFGWNLPADIRPIEDAGLPTTNMMGYDIPEKFGGEQLAFLRELGFAAEHTPESVNREIPLLIDVMAAVSAELGFVKAFKCLSASYLQKGSQAQNMIVEPEQPNDRTPAGKCNVIAKNLTKLASSVSYLGGSVLVLEAEKEWIGFKCSRQV